MEKEQMIEYLRNYKLYKYQAYCIEKDIKKLNNNIFEYNIKLTNIMGINSDIHSQNKISDKVPNAVIEIEKKREANQKKIDELKLELTCINQKVEDVDNFLNALYDHERLVIENFYVNHRSKFDIGENIFLKEFGVPKSEKTITNIINKSFEKLL